MSQNPLESLFSAPPSPVHKGVRSESVYRAMRDGVQIAVDVMLPADLAAGDRVPALMIMARYWRSFALRVPDRPGKALIGPRNETADDLIARGFALIVVDGRGSGASTGHSLTPWWPEELADYAEVAGWVAEQPWCSGAIGAYGISYEGATSLRLAALGESAVRAVVPQEIEYDVYADIALPGGIFNEAFIREWHTSNALLDQHKMSSLFPWSARLFVRGVRPVDADRKAKAMLAQARQEHLNNTDVFSAMGGVVFRDDPFGETGAALDDFSLFPHQKAIEEGGAALFSWGSWMDGASAHAALRTFNTLSNPQIAVIGSWKHEMTADGSPFLAPGQKPDPLPDQQVAALAQFFDATLKRNDPPQGKRLYYTTLGEGGWKETTAFPLPNATPQTWYFQPDHGLAPEEPSGTGEDPYRVDYTATTGAKNRWHTQMAKPVVYPDRAREDGKLLTYTSAPLAADLEVTGFPMVTLSVASSTDDGAFFVYLEDIDERGVVRYVAEGQLRGLHRQLSDEAPPCWTGMPYRTFRRADSRPMPVGEMVELVIGLQPTSVLFRKGHRIRVALAGADANTFARIPAEGTPEWRVGWGGVQASRIELPVVQHR